MKSDLHVLNSPQIRSTIITIIMSYHLILQAVLPSIYRFAFSLEVPPRILDLQFW